MHRPLVAIHAEILFETKIIRSIIKMRFRDAIRIVIGTFVATALWTVTVKNFGNVAMDTIYRNLKEYLANSQAKG